ARHVGIIDQDDILLENGYLLLKTWEREQRLDGFLDSASAGLEASSRRHLLRSAVSDGLKAGYTGRSAGWQGWQFFARHLVPARAGGRESQLLRSLLLDVKADTRGLRSRLQAMERALEGAPSRAQSEFAELARYFDNVTD